MPEEEVKVLDSADKPDEAVGGADYDLSTIKKLMSMEGQIHPHDEGDLEKILEHAHREGVKTDGDLAVWFKQLCVKLGTPELGQTRLRQVLHYLDLDAQIGELVKEQQGYTR